MSPVFFTGVALGSLSAGLIGWSLFEFAFSASENNIPSISFLKSVKPLSSAHQTLAMGLAVCLVIALWGGMDLGLLALILFVSTNLVLRKFPKWKQKHDRDKRYKKMKELFPQTLGIALQALKTGQTVPQVIEYLSQESPQPLGEEWALVCAEMTLGSSAEQALTKMGESYPRFQEFHQFLESYKISRSTGANLTQLVQVLLEGMEEKNRIWRKMEALTAQAKLSGLMVGLLPFLLGFVFFLMDPGLIVPLFTEKIGLAILLLAAILEAIGFLWIRQLLQLEI